MIEFILIACLAKEPETCRTETRLLTDLTLIQCMTSAQFLLVDWAKRHPDWRVQRHSCRVHDPDTAQI